ncbi:MAG: RNB domain-containing ribonuclease [Solirubrobacterales bacterium]|nr:RNB domain-containing ribonuclease [Solirubrobacterales bacterium]
MAGGLKSILGETGVQISFPAEVEAEARAAALRRPAAQRVDFPFVTIDPPGSRDLDQALHIERLGDGHRVRYAIADVACFVEPASALDDEAHSRGVTVYTPEAKAPLHPTALSEGAASLLPGEWRAAVLWTIDLDASGEPVATGVERVQVRSVAQHTYEDVPADIAELMGEVGERRLALEGARGGVRLAVPEQVVERTEGAWTVSYRVPLASEEHNAQISLLTGMAAATLMLRGGTGILRTQPPPDERSLNRFRRQAAALAIPWADGVSYPDFIRGLDVALPAHAALMHEATGIGRGAGYTTFDGAPPSEHVHFSIAADYAHATAPLRRLQDRYVSECCLAAQSGEAPPAWVHDGLGPLPEAMAAGERRANAVERAVVDLVEAILLEARVGETFDAVVVDKGLLQLRDPAVRAHLEEGCPEPGSEVSVRLDAADPSQRKVQFSLA